MNRMGVGLLYGSVTLGKFRTEGGRQRALRERVFKEEETVNSQAWMWEHTLNV